MILVVREVVVVQVLVNGESNLFGEAFELLAFPFQRWEVRGKPGSRRGKGDRTSFNGGEGVKNGVQVGVIKSSQDVRTREGVRNPEAVQ